MTKIELKIIKMLADYPEREFYGQEIVEKIKCSKAAASGLLPRLAAKKIIFRKIKGRMKFYQINQDSAEVKRIKIDWALSTIEPLLSKLEKQAKKIVLFGSAARGEQTADSDLDLLILTDDKKIIYSVLKKISPNLKVKALVKTPGEWSEQEIKEPEFFAEVKNGITLHTHVSRI